MTDTLAAAAGSMTEEQLAACAPGRWGVWDEHRREWAVPPTLRTERDGWAALLDVDSLWPRMLDVRENLPAPAPAPPPAEALCPSCYGDRTCDSCDRDCTRCDGEGTVPRDELTETERRDVERIEARAAERERKAREAAA